MNETIKTIVVFRKDRAKPYTVFALFPELPADNYGFDCTCYQSIGQHCAANFYGCIAQSRPAKPEEYAPLAQELTKLGYELVIRKRVAHQIHRSRQELAKKESNKIV